MTKWKQKSLDLFFNSTFSIYAIACSFVLKWRVALNWDMKTWKHAIFLYENIKMKNRLVFAYGLINV